MVYHCLVNLLTVVDVPLDNISTKRPDASFRLINRLLPNPPPAWMRFLPNGKPHPNIVVEVAVQNESSTEIIDIMERYFSATTSVRVWIGMKVWLQDRKFWVAWAHRHPTGTGGVLQSQMQFPPHHASFDNPVNVIYSIPSQTVYGPGIALPPNSPLNLIIDCEQVRVAILDALS